jgi:mono/diheme cytochrome c family protein
MRIRVFVFITGLVMVLAACAPSATSDGASSSGTVSSSVSAEQLEAGAQVYANKCTFCHGADGLGGDRGPAHAGNPELAYAPYTVSRILYGYGYKKMPSYASRLTDEEIADVATYIRNSWGNNFGAVSSEWVAAARR